MVTRPASAMKRSSRRSVVYPEGLVSPAMRRVIGPSRSASNASVARMGKASGLIMFKASFASTIRGMKVIGLAADKGSVPQRFKLGRIHRILRHGEAALRQDALDSDHSTLGLPLHRRPAIVGYDAMARHADHLLADRIFRRLVATSPQSAQLGFDFASSDSWRVFLLWFGYRRFRP
jgi:hypothetical protein